MAIKAAKKEAMKAISKADPLIADAIRETIARFGKPKTVTIAADGKLWVFGEN